MHVLAVKGNAGDTVSFVDVQWVKVGTVVDGAITYNRYIDGNAEVRIAGNTVFGAGVPVGVLLSSVQPTTSTSDAAAIEISTRRNTARR